MAKLYFNYSTMNAGKSTSLLQAAYNYNERGLSPLLFTPALDDRYERNSITSRIGLSSKAVPFDDKFNFVKYVDGNVLISCIFVDEAQFLTEAQVDQLASIVDVSHIPVMTYGLRTDFQGNLFEGSKRLLAVADSLKEVKTICHCSRKATMVLRMDKDGKVLREGGQVEIGGNDKYTSVCRKHFYSA